VRREHEQAALALASNERETEPRLRLDLPTIDAQALDRRNHCAVWVRGGLELLRLDHLPLKAEHDHPARCAVVGIYLVAISAHPADCREGLRVASTSSPASRTLYKVGFEP
jgi:hypothetical protein